MGFYELAIAQAYVDRGKAIESLDHALTLDAVLDAGALYRAVLKIEDGKPAAAIGDLQILLDRDPRNHHVLVRLGQAYLALDRAGDAARVLKRALDCPERAVRSHGLPQSRPRSSATSRRPRWFNPN